MGDICSSFLVVVFFPEIEENKVKRLSEEACVDCFLFKKIKKKTKQNKTQKSGFPSAPENLRIRARLSKSERARWM